MSRRDQELAAEVLAAVAGGGGTPPPVRRAGRSHAELLEVFERALRAQNATDCTRRSLLSAARVFLRGLAKPIDRVRVDDVRRHLAARSPVISPVSQCSELSRLRAFFEALVEAKVVRADPTEGLSVDQAESPPQQILEDDVVARLLAASITKPRYPSPFFEALALRDRACLELLCTGLRQRQVRDLRVVDMNLLEASLTVRPMKRGKGRSLALPPASVPWLARYLTEARPQLVRPEGQDEGALLVSFTGRPLDARTGVHRIVARVANKAGVKAQPHAFRRGVATSLARNGASLPAVQSYLGHASLETTAGYVAVGMDELCGAVEVLDRGRQPPVSRRTS